MNDQNPCADPARSVTMLTTCMGRLHFLRSTFPSWIHRTEFRIVVVDYSCPEGAGDWVENMRYGSRVSVVYRAAERHAGRPVFNVSKARNAGLAAVDTPYVMFIDADVRLRSGVQAWLLDRLSPERFFRFSRYYSDLGGTMVAPVAAIRELGGFDEGFVGWGSEDIDMKHRLSRLGLHSVQIPKSLAIALPHSNAVRARNYIETDFAKAHAMNVAYRAQKKEKP